jgi:hypothetical protein
MGSFDTKSNFYSNCSPFCSYGLKSWEETPIDLIKDDGCATMPTVAGLFSVRSPDAIATIVIGEDTYIALANEVRVTQTFLTPIVKRLVLNSSLLPLGTLLG